MISAGSSFGAHSASSGPGWQFEGRSKKREILGGRPERGVGEGMENVRVMSASRASLRTRKENGLCDAG